MSRRWRWRPVCVPAPHGRRFTGIPIFLTRAFYHGELLCHRRSGIREPKDLEGRKVGVRSYTFTPGVWTRGILAAEYGVDLGAVHLGPVGRRNTCRSTSRRPTWCRRPTTTS